MLNELLERKITEAAEWFCDNPNCDDIEDAMRELVAEAMSIENEECAGICDRFAARDMRPAECAGAIRMRSNNQVKADAEGGRALNAGLEP